MYLTINTLGNEKVRAGEIVVLKEDRKFGQVGAFMVGGGAIGYAAGAQPEGCLDIWTVWTKIKDNRILCKVAIVLPGAIILHTDSKVFDVKEPLKYVQKEGYGILALK